MKNKYNRLRLAKFSMILAASLLVSAAHPDSAVESKHAASAERSPITVPTNAVETIDAFHAALKRGDTKAALMHLSEDALIFESGTVENSRAEYESHHLKSDAEFSAATSRTLVSERVTDANDIVSVMRVELVKGSFRGRSINSRSIETMVLRRTNGKWRIVHIHWSSVDLKTK